MEEGFPVQFGLMSRSRTVDGGSLYGEVHCIMAYGDMEHVDRQTDTSVSC